MSNFKVQDFLKSPPEVNRELELPRHLYLEWPAFQKMYTKNSEVRRLANPKLVEQLASQFQDCIKDNNSEIEIKTIIDRQSLLYINDTEKTLNKLTDEELLEADPGRLVAERAMAIITVKGIHDDYSPMLVVNMTDKGEEIAYGQNVEVCSNLTILHADQRYSTFQKGKRMKLEEILVEANSLMSRYEKNFDDDLKIIESLKKQEVSRTQWHQFVGELYCTIHPVNSHRLNRTLHLVPESRKDLPITATELGRIIVEADSPSHEVYRWDGDITNKWNLINWGTEMLKIERGSSDKSVLRTNSRWTQMVLEQDFSKN